MKPVHAPDAPIEEIRRALADGWEGPPVYVVVPRHMGLEVERSLLKRLGPGAGFRLRVTHWSRLAGEISRTAGMPERPLLTRALWTALVRLRIRTEPTLLEGLLSRPEARRGIERRIAETLWDAFEAFEGATPSGFRDIAGPIEAAVLDRSLELVAPALGKLHLPSTLMREARHTLEEGRLKEGSRAFILANGEAPLGERLLGPLLRTHLNARPLEAEDLFPAKAAARPLAEAPLEIVLAQDAAEEGRHAALRVGAWLYQGCAPDEIVVASAKLENLAPELTRAFEKAGIPLDVALAAPGRGGAARLIASLLRLGKGRDEAGLLAAASTGLVPDLDAPSVRALLRSPRMRRQRAGGLEPHLVAFADFTRTWPERGRLWDHVGHLAGLLDTLGVSASLRETGASVVDEWNAAANALRVAADALDETPVTADDAREVLADILADVTLPVPIPRAGAVLATNLDGVFGRAWRKVILAGLVDGTVPPGGQATGMKLRDAVDHPLVQLHNERERWRASIGERLMVLRAESFTLTRPLSGEDGRALEPALFLSELADRRQDVAASPAGAKEVPLSRQDAARILALSMGVKSRLGQDWGREAMMSRALIEVAGPQVALASLDAPMPEAEPPLPRDLARQLFGRRISLSDFEARAACPTRHWARVLRLGEERRDVLDPARWGTVVHEVLRELVRGAPPAGLGSLSTAALRFRVVRATKRALERAGPFPSEGPVRSLLTLEIFRTALRLAEDDRKSRFRPVAEEASRLFLLTLTDKGTLEVSCKIDRIDRSSDLIRIVDYKTGEPPLHPARILGGLELQLAAYALALTEGNGGEDDAAKGAVPAVLVFWPVPGGGRRVLVPDRRGEGEGRRKLDPTGFYADTPEVREALGGDLSLEGSDGRSGGFKLPPASFKRLLTRTRAELEMLAQEALEGVAAPRPYRLGSEIPCKDCEFKAICRFRDVQHIERRLPKATRKDFVAALSEGADAG